MVKESTTETTNAIGWLQDQIYQLKADMGQVEQQLEHVQSVETQMTEQLRAVERSLREVSTSAAIAPRLQEELNHTIALVVQLQDQQAEAVERVDLLGRSRNVDQDRDQQDWIDIARRTEQLERQVAQWLDRQAGVDEVGRRFQEGMSLVQQSLQDIDKRLDATESKAARGLEGANRAEYNLTQVEATILALQREDETIAERARVASDVAHRVETKIDEQVSGLGRLEMLAERIELHRAERQRLEDRALRLEEEFGELRTRLEREEHQGGRLVSQQAGLGSRIDGLQEQLAEQRAAIVEQIRRLTTSQERTKRTQIQQLEREVREMRQYVADLSEQ
jgi:chromosome segregation ATPase